MKQLLLTAALCLGALAAPASVLLSSFGKPKAVIIQSADATAAEQHAVNELRLHLNRITGALFAVQTNPPSAPKNAILVGPGTLTEKHFAEIDFTKLGPEEFVVRTKGDRLLL